MRTTRRRGREQRGRQHDVVLHGGTFLLRTPILRPGSTGRPAAACAEEPSLRASRSVCRIAPLRAARGRSEPARHRPGGPVVGHARPCSGRRGVVADGDEDARGVARHAVDQLGRRAQRARARRRPRSGRAGRRGRAGAGRRGRRPRGRRPRHAPSSVARGTCSRHVERQQERDVLAERLRGHGAWRRPGRGARAPARRHRPTRACSARSARRTRRRSATAGAATGCSTGVMCTSSAVRAPTLSPGRVTGAPVSPRGSTAGHRDGAERARRCGHVALRGWPPAHPRRSPTRRRWRVRAGRGGSTGRSPSGTRTRGASSTSATPLELLVATVLSAQTTDVRVNQMTPTLFARYPDAAACAGADPTELEEILRPTGFFRAKARSLIGLGQALRGALRRRRCRGGWRTS